MLPRTSCLLSAAAAIALCFAAPALANTDVIRLDMGPVRGPTAPATRKYPISAAPPRIPPQQNPDVFCTDGANLDDIFCDMRRLYGSNVWKTRSAPDVYEVDVDYPDRGVRVCTSSFERPNRTETPLRLPFSSFKCEGEGGEPETGLPPFRMSGATSLRITTRKPDDFYFSCTLVFKRAVDQGRGATSGGRGTKGPVVVRFHYDTISCLSPVTLDRETTENPGSPCGHDGRRCRPKK